MRIALLLLVVMATGGCVAEHPAEAPDPAADCVALVRPIEPGLIGLPSGGATIDSAVLVAPAPLMMNPKVPFSPAPPDVAVIPANPEYCKVMGSIAALDANAPLIRFEVNLPTSWSGRSLQYGGGGLNGNLITGLGFPAAARPDLPSPLARGFVTYGTDSGHQNAAGTPLHAFALNDEALQNFAFGSYKKVRDVAVELMKRRYGSGPRRLYFIGYSEGGREGLTMAQRFPNDFDGIFSRVPVINWTGLQAAGARVGALQMKAGAWLTPDAAKLVEHSVLAKCDARDGLADHVVGDYQGCRDTFSAAELPRCDAKRTKDCLNDAQLAVVSAMWSRYTFGFPLANGVTSYPGWPRGGEAATHAGPVGGWVSWQSGTAPPTLPAGPSASIGWLYAAGGIQYFLTKDVNADPRTFDPAKNQARIREISDLMDSTNPDLSAFAQHGGKLVMAENMADYAQSPYAGIEYFQSVVAHMGRPTVDSFMRLYVSPGVDHMGTGAPSNYDMLATLIDWVEYAQAPRDLREVSQTAQPPFTVIKEWPLCEYPGFPHYLGGDPALAQSFSCAAK